MKNKNEKLRLTVKAALFAAMLCVLSPLTIPAARCRSASRWRRCISAARSRRRCTRWPARSAT